MNIKRSEIWRVNLDPTIGAEIKKTRPVVVVSSNYLGKLPVKLVAPVTGWRDQFRKYAWHVQIDPNQINGLSKVSSIDTLQVRAVDSDRFIEKIGEVTPEQMRAITAAIALVIEY